MKPWTRLPDTNVVHVGHRIVVQKNFRTNRGKVYDADIIDADGFESAIIIALTRDNKVVIARQFRCGPELVLDELPGGMIDEGETPEQSAIRELQEETGYAPGKVEYLGYAYMNAWQNTRHHYYLARDCYEVASSNPDEDEEIEVDLISITDLINNARQARMTDVQAVLLAYDTLRELEER